MSGNCNAVDAITVDNFGTDPSSLITPMDAAALVQALECGQLDLGQINFLFRTLFHNSNIFKSCIVEICDGINNPENYPGLYTLLTNTFDNSDLGFVLNPE